MNDNTLIFRCFASGSSGNCYYLGTATQGILIDAGISARAIHKHLKEMNLDFPNIMGVLITHDHADHIRAVGTLGEKIHLPIYATPIIHEGIGRNYGVQEKLRTAQRYIELGQEFEIANLKVNTFAISHDSSQCVGYIIDYEDQRFMLATDCGEPNPQLEAAIRSANHIVIEANHDEQMLLNGPYPTYLKQRILSPKGHQSNAVCGKLLVDNYHPGIRNVFLCHLSQENNSPQVAENAVTEDLIYSLGIINHEDIFVTALARLTPSPIYQLNDCIITPTQEPECEPDEQEDPEDEDN